MGSRKVFFKYLSLVFFTFSVYTNILMRYKMVLIIKHCYNMACSALFLQRAQYTVQCANIMHSRTPSFVITPPFLINSINRYLLKNIPGNKIRRILVKWFCLSTFDLNNFKHPWLSPCTWRNKIMFMQPPIRRFKNDFGPVHVRSQYSYLCCDCDVMELNGIVALLLM